MVIIRMRFSSWVSADCDGEIGNGEVQQLRLTHKEETRIIPWL